MLNERVSRQSVFLCCFAFAANWTLRKSLRFDPSLQHAPRWKILEIQDLLDVRFLETHVRKRMHEFPFFIFRSQRFLPWSYSRKLNNLSFLCSFTIAKLRSCFLFQRTELQLSSFEQSNFPSYSSVPLLFYLTSAFCWLVTLSPSLLHSTHNYAIKISTSTALSINYNDFVMNKVVSFDMEPKNNRLVRVMSDLVGLFTRLNHGELWRGHLYGEDIMDIIRMTGLA